MKNKNAGLVFGLFLLVSAFFIACENPVMGKWWVDPKPAEDDPHYIPIMKSVPHLVYETIIQDNYIYEQIIEYVKVPLPPEQLIQNINIINIEYIIFAGDSTYYNGPPGSTFEQKTYNSGGTALTLEEKRSNNAIIEAMANALKDYEGVVTSENPDGDKYFLILHGHANPVTGTAQEANDLAKLSLARANEVDRVIKEVYTKGFYISPPPPVPELKISVGSPPDTPLGPISELVDPVGEGNKRITTRGYGGGRNISGASNSYTSLNRRVEAILFTVETIAVTGGGG